MKVFLAQTDTTVGFLSHDASRLETIKSRDGNKPFLKVFADFKALQSYVRIPNHYRRHVRYARKTTFVVKNRAFRYVDDPHHAKLIAPYGWFYSTSANKSGASYDEIFCFKHADWIVEDRRGLKEKESSMIFKLSDHHHKKLR